MRAVLGRIPLYCESSLSIAVDAQVRSVFGFRRKQNKTAAAIDQWRKKSMLGLSSCFLSDFAMGERYSHIFWIGALLNCVFFDRQLTCDFYFLLLLRHKQEFSCLNTCSHSHAPIFIVRKVFFSLHHFLLQISSLVWLDTHSRWTERIMRALER